jgi:hypothetical protein
VTNKHTVVKQFWIESERGWGTRPDGYTLHLNKTDRHAFIKAYWDRMPREVPVEYSRPEGEPVLVDVDGATFEKIKASRNGIWL